MKFLDYVTRVWPKFTLRLRVTPKLREHALGVCERVIAQEHENAIRHSPWLAHDRDIAYAIAIAKIDRSRLKSCSQGPARDANCDPRSTNSKMGIGSGHRRVPNTRQYDVDSKILDKMSHGGASAVDKSTTGRFLYQQGTFLRGLQVKIRTNR
jgi:hypothetical protein